MVVIGVFPLLGRRYFSFLNVLRVGGKGLKGFTDKNVWVLLILLIIGGIIGSCLGVILARIWPGITLFNPTEMVGLPPTTLDLQVLSITFGFTLSLNLLTVIGFILAYLIYRKM